MVLPGLWVRLRLWIFPVALPLVLCTKVLQRGLLSPLGLAWLGLSRLGLSWLGMARWMGRASLGLETMVGPGSRAFGARAMSHQGRAENASVAT